MSDYANPLAGAKVNAERIDQGVDYAGTGTLSAIARGVITKISPYGQSGWPGNYLEYQITEPGPFKGQRVYYAEGVTPTVKVGDIVNAGDPVATIIPGWSSGIELGYASGVGTASYASQHGGYSEGQRTAAGDAFSQLVGALGGPAGNAGNRPIVGSAPPNTANSDLLAFLHESVTGGQAMGLLPAGPGTPLDTISGPSSPAGKAATGVFDTIQTGVDITKAFAKFLSNPVPALLTVAFVLGGALMIYSGLGQMLGFNQPVRSSAKTAVALGAKA